MSFRALLVEQNEDGKAKAQEHYNNLMEQGLERVE